MAPECLRQAQLSEVGWQSIPHWRSCVAECSVSELPTALVKAYLNVERCNVTLCYRLHSFRIHHIT